MAKITKRTQGVMEFVETIFLNEMGQIVNHKGAAFLKFLILLQGIEFLGACYDDDDFSKRKESEARFNRGLSKLGEKYLKFTESGHHQYFYNFLRCPMIHQFKHDQSKITLGTENSVNYMDLHLKLNEDNRLYVILEPFYNDIRSAAKVLIEDIGSGKRNIAKIKNPFLTINTIEELQIQTT